MPLHVIASSLKTERSLSLSYEAGNFWDLESLAKCMKGESVSWSGLYFYYGLLFNAADYFLCSFDALAGDRRPTGQHRQRL